MGGCWIIDIRHLGNKRKPRLAVIKNTAELQIFRWGSYFQICFAKGSLPMGFTFLFGAPPIMSHPSPVISQWLVRRLHNIINPEFLLQLLIQDYTKWPLTEKRDMKEMVNGNMLLEQKVDRHTWRDRHLKWLKLWI